MTDQVKEIPIQKLSMDEIERMNNLLKKSEENIDQEERKKIRKKFKKFVKKS